MPDARYVGRVPLTLSPRRSPRSRFLDDYSGNPSSRAPSTNFSAIGRAMPNSEKMRTPEAGFELEPTLDRTRRLRRASRKRQRYGVKKWKQAVSRVDLRPPGETGGRLVVLRLPDRRHAERQMSLESRGIERAQPQGAVGVEGCGLGLVSEGVDQRPRNSGRWRKKRSATRRARSRSSAISWSLVRTMMTHPATASAAASSMSLAIAVRA